KTGRVVASFPVEEADQIMLVTDGGQLIRCPVDGIRIAGRSTQGVIVFTTAEGERVVSVERLSEEGEDNGGGCDATSLKCHPGRAKREPGPDAHATLRARGAPDRPCT